MLNFLKAPPHKQRIAKNDIDKTYKKLRLQVFIGIFIGYAGYYFIRKNFALAIPDLIKEGFTKTELGLALSFLAISYGLSKFIMGNVSDRSNVRYFMPLGLFLSAITMIFMGVMPIATSSILIMSVLLFINGWFQGMGWPPSGRTMVYWFSIKERGTKMSIWNVAHNIGGALMPLLAILGVELFNDWHAKFYFPGMVALIVAIIIFILLRDRPKSEGLPSIEAWKNDYPKGYKEKSLEDEKKGVSAMEIFTKHILPNKLLWSIAFANAFVYLVRYGIQDWAPTYLIEVKGFTEEASSWAYSAYEIAAIPGTLLSGWLSDKVFKGKRAPVSIIYMVLIVVAIFIYWHNPVGHPIIDNICLIAIGFLIYGPVMLIGVHALDLVDKEAAGTAAGLTGLFGYFLGTSILANILGGYIIENYEWDGYFILMITASIVAIILIALTIQNPDKKKVNT
ncbi:MAG: glycerol-3-phosphate transporter [Flavobacteriaceae bacterium]|nr:glycerol-3-phosphate transporter [Flavobacteriaceae bacterium]